MGHYLIITCVFLIIMCDLALVDCEQEICSRKSGASAGENGQDGSCSRNSDIGIPENELRILLIGKTGVGKSTTGNALLGKREFKAQLSSSSVTDKTEYKKADRYGKKLLIVDTPGLYDTGKTIDDVMFEISKCHAITSPGLHAIVLVLQVGRFTLEEQNTVKIFLQYFGESVTDYMLVVFTHKNSLTDDDQTIKQYVEQTSEDSDLYILLKRINFRYVAFGYKGDSNEREEEVQDLLKIIDEMTKTNGGNYYTNEMYKEAERLMTERWEEEQRRIKKENDEKNEKLVKSTREEFEEQYRRKEEERERYREESKRGGFLETLVNIAKAIFRKLFGF